MHRAAGRSFQARATAVLALVVSSLPLAASVRPRCAVVDIDQIGWQHLEEAKTVEGLGWWIELDGDLVVCGTEVTIASLARQHEVTPVVGGLDPDRLLVAAGFHPTELDQLGLEVVARSGRLTLLRGEASWQQQSEETAFPGRPHQVLFPAPANSVLARQAANNPPRPAQIFDLGVQDLVDLVDADRWFADIVALAAFNRYTHNSGVLDARDWLVERFELLPGLQVTTPSFMVGGTVAFNVVAMLEGRERPDDWYIVGGHYDSISEIPQQLAPGAEDNASGCAGVLEMARILTAHPPDSTLLFICFSGEEQGLFGSEDHVDDLIATGDLAKIQTMLNLDMIGYTSDTDLDCLLETDPFAQSLLTLFTDAALEFTTLRIVTSLSTCCSDHVPYLDANVPALLTIENDWFQYPFYHTSNDLPQHLTLAMGEEILKMNVAAMAQMIGAPAAGVFSDGFESGDTGAWSSSVP